MTWILVGLGGLVGSLARYGLAGLVQRAAGDRPFPYGTLAVNTLGCLVIGFLATLATERGVLGPGSRAFLLVGVLGGFTTFSTFGFETWSLLADRRIVAAASNAGIHLFVAFFAVAAGAALARAL